MNARQQAEELCVAMARESWDDTVSRIQTIMEACANLGAELAMAKKAMPVRRADGVWDAFLELESLIKLSVQLPDGPQDASQGEQVEGGKE